MREKHEGPGAEPGMMARRIELASGVASLFLGVAGWAWAVFGPTYTAAGSYSTGRNTAPVTVTQPGSLRS